MKNERKDFRKVDVINVSDETKLSFAHLACVGDGRQRWDDDDDEQMKVAHTCLLWQRMPRGTMSQRCLSDTASLIDQAPPRPPILSTPPPPAPHPHPLVHCVACGLASPLQAVTLVVTEKRPYGGDRARKRGLSNPSFVSIFFTSFLSLFHMHHMHSCTPSSSHPLGRGRGQCPRHLTQGKGCIC